MYREISEELVAPAYPSGEGHLPKAEIVRQTDLMIGRSDGFPVQRLEVLNTTVMSCLRYLVRLGERRGLMPVLPSVPIRMQTKLQTEAVSRENSSGHWIASAGV